MTVLTSDEVWFELTKPIIQRFGERAATLRNLVHYTSFAALKGIVEREEIWFSPVSGMNDFAEVERGKELLVKLTSNGQSLNECIAGLRKLDSVFLDEINSEYGRRRDQDLYNTFVTCWSECDLEQGTYDNLTMWRGYASDGNGVAIVIDPAALAMDQGEASEILAVPVSYETEAEFAARAKCDFEHYCASLNQLGPAARTDHRGFSVAAFAELCSYLAISHKHPGFVAEREWRFVWRSYLDQEGLLQSFLRSELTARGLLERFCFPLKPNPQVSTSALNIRELIKAVVVGPCEDAYLKQRAVCLLLERAGFQSPAQMVRVSEIPYRTLR